MNKNIQTILVGYELISGGLDKAYQSGVMDEDTYTSLKDKLGKISPRSKNVKKTVRQVKVLMEELEAYFASYNQDIDAKMNEKYPLAMKVEEEK